MPRFLCALLAAIAGCASLPDTAAREPSRALADTAASRLGRALAPAISAHPGKTGIYSLGDGRDAFAPRVLLARAAEGTVEFADLDVLAVGAVVPEVSASFDAYWNSASAFPVAALIKPAEAQVAARVREAWARLNERPEAARYVAALRSTALVQQL